ncbi:aspartyl protease family protein [Hymenobacter sp. BT770]|uniref:aspartyl protease family protein n=1 Tax=Hymenobacter sp. BT770 TaxID=2886942 RepID=UPI001D122357|nr:aspartyl protease family protein [Hymenobacter sp. BT770]MCC3152354.1 aspartyl protease family protein [Hymenobacter sp. BT770]MDO3414167.1 aspartyl protease family protein [Hymenobacter sp. BT770]
MCLLVFLSFCWETGGSAHAQLPASAALPTSASPFVFTRAKRKKSRAPVFLQRNLLIVKATLNHAGPYNFLLDTGVNTSIITSAELADSLKLRHGQQYRVMGAGGMDSGLLAYQTDSVRVELPKIVAANMTWLVLSEDVLNLSGYVGVPIHGILGSELFRSFVVTLQPEVGEIVLSAPSAYKAPKGKQWTSIPLSIQNNKAYITTPVQVSDSLTLPLKLVLDTGASHALSIELDSDPRLKLPPQRLSADLGRGLTGLVQGYLGRVAKIELGRYTLNSVLTSFPNSADVHRRVEVPRNGNIGYELLKRFSLVIDYPHERLLLRPNNTFKDPFEHDMCGVELLATGPDYRRYLVLRVMPNSPASDAGLAVDDELLSINFIPANVFSLTQLDRMLHSEDGRALLMVLRRPDGNLHTATVKLKRQI